MTVTRSVEGASREKLSTMVALRGTEVMTIPLAGAVAQPKLVSLDNQLVKITKSIGVVFG